MSDTTYSCVWCDLFMCVMWLICVWCDWFVCVIWLIYACDETRRDWELLRYSKGVRVTWLNHMCGTTHTYVSRGSHMVEPHMCGTTHLCGTYEVPHTCVALHVCHVAHIWLRAYVSRGSSICVARLTHMSIVVPHILWHDYGDMCGTTITHMNESWHDLFICVSPYVWHDYGDMCGTNMEP